MKKIIVITLLTVIAASLCSCSKKEASLPAGPAQTLPPTFIANKINTASKWLSLPFFTTTDPLTSWLQARYDLPATGYDNTTHKQFVYIELQGRDSHDYRALPIQIASYNGVNNFSYTTDQSGFVLKIKNNDAAAQPFTNQDFLVKTSKYLFLVVTDSTFRMHNIDWTSFETVKNTLSSSIHFPQ